MRLIRGRSSLRGSRAIPPWKRERLPMAECPVEARLKFLKRTPNVWGSPTSRTMETLDVVMLCDSCLYTYIVVTVLNFFLSLSLSLTRRLWIKRTDNDNR